MAGMYEKQATKLLYFLMAVVWIMILLPKELQLLAYILVIVYWAVVQKRRIVFDKTAIAFILYAVVHLFSIIANSFAGEHDIRRIIASLNTCVIWIVAAMIFGIVKYSNVDLKRLGRIFICNIGILFVLYLLYRTTDLQAINYWLDSRSLGRADYVTSGYARRFTGLMEYDTLVSLFIILQLPVAYYCLRNKNLFFRIILCIIALLPTVACHSRTGMIGIVLELVLFFYDATIQSHIKKGQERFIIIAGIMCFAIIIFFNSQELFSHFVTLFTARQGSNVARSRIYITSLNAVCNNNLLLGIGIKDLLGEYPLGSHCTYIGIFYKTGVIGSIIWIFGVVKLLKKEYQKLIPDTFYIFGSILVFWIMLMTEDLDGANWLIVTFFMLQGVYVKAGQG